MKIKAGSILYNPYGDYLILLVRVGDENVYVVEEHMSYIMHKHHLDGFELIGEL